MFPSQVTFETSNFSPSLASSPVITALPSSVRTLAISISLDEYESVSSGSVDGRCRLEVQSLLQSEQRELAEFGCFDRLSFTRITGHAAFVSNV